MLRRIVTGVAVAGLIAEASYAQGAEAAILDCERQLIATQALVQGKVEADALTEDEQEAIYEILDKADALCADGKSDRANKTLAAIGKMIANKE